VGVPLMAILSEPRTKSEWQDAVDLAHAWLAFDAARRYGLVIGGPIVNVQRCWEILERGDELGHQPTSDSIERFARGLVA
jgi:hypothetical protein